MTSLSQIRQSIVTDDQEPGPSGIKSPQRKKFISTNIKKGL